MGIHLLLARLFGSVVALSQLPVVRQALVAGFTEYDGIVLLLTSQMVIARMVRTQSDVLSLAPLSLVPCSLQSHLLNLLPFGGLQVVFVRHAAQLC